MCAICDDKAVLCVCPNGPTSRIFECDTSHSEDFTTNFPREASRN